MLTRRDALLNGGNLTSDEIAFVFDTFRDKNSRNWFELNPLGVKGDHKDGDASYDPVWEGASHIDSLGWTAEFRIPFSQLRFSRATEQIVGNAGLAHDRPPQRAGHVGVLEKQRVRRPGLLRHSRRNRVASQPRQIELVAVRRLARNDASASPSSDPYHSDSQETVLARAAT